MYEISHVLGNFTCPTSMNVVQSIIRAQKTASLLIYRTNNNVCGNSEDSQMTTLRFVNHIKE